MSCRAVNSRDIDALTRLDRRCFDRGIAYSRDVFESILHHPRNLGYVIEEEEGIRAFILAVWERRTAEVITVDVAPDSRRRGIGSRLLTMVESELTARGVKDLFLHSSVRNSPALRMYERGGYRVITRLRDYYRRGEDAFLMNKSLGPRAIRSRDYR